MAITGAPSLVRQYCKPIASDTTNWPDATLNTWWDRAHSRLKQLLCPPFAEADFDLLNLDATNSDSGDDLIARMAALLIFEALPGSGGQDYNRLRTDLFGSPDAENPMTGWIERLQTGEASLFDSSGNRISRTSAVYHTRETTPGRVFSQTLKDSEGTISGTTGSLDQFDKL